MKNRTANQFSVIKRLIKQVFSFYPKTFIAIMILTVVNAVLGTLPVIFQQNVIAILQNAWDNGWTWEYTRPLVMDVVKWLILIYVVAIIVNIINTQLMASFTQGTLDKMRKTLFSHMEKLPIR